MSPNTGLLFSQIAIFAGAILAALGGLGAFHFRGKADAEKNATNITQQAALNQKIENLLSGNQQLRIGNDELKQALAPFKQYALDRFPNADVSTALKKLEADLQRIDAITKPTVFKVISTKEEVAPEGRHVYVIELSPVGNVVVPILTIIAQTGDGTRVEAINVTGPTVPIMATTGSSEKGDGQKIEYRTVSPGPIQIRITTAKIPASIRFDIAPLAEESVTIK
jgi:hypothetical protein